jgi:oligopeptide transport system substrate-binding protein
LHFAYSSLTVPRKPRHPLLASVVACLALAAVGCTRDPNDVKKPDASQSPVQSLVRGLGGEPETLDPRLAADNPSLALMLDLYEGLTREAGDGTIIPGAAESWQVSTDGTAWTFVLRPNLRWSDGTPLDALSFARGIAEAKANDSPAPYGQLLSGIRSMVVAPDGGALTLHLWRPMPQLPALLALPVAAPERPEGMADAQNGPYRLATRVPGQHLELERNPNYHGRDEVSIERVRWLTLDELGTELNLYRSGKLDVTSEVPNARIGWIREHLPGELHVAPYLSTYGYAVNLARLPDVAARAALAMAIDRERITTQVTGAGEAPAMEWVPPGLPDYPGTRFDWAALDDTGRLEQARARWRAASAPSRLTLCTDASENHRRTAVALIDQWHTALGIDVELVELEWKAYLAERAQPGRCDLVRLGWSADYADPEAFLELFESGHPQNTQRYSSTRYDTLLYQSRRAADAVERLQRLAEAEAVLLDEAPVIPVFHRVAKRLVKPVVTGVTANPLGHLPTRELRWQQPSVATN